MVSVIVPVAVNSYTVHVVPLLIVVYRFGDPALIVTLPALVRLSERYFAPLIFDPPALLTLTARSPHTPSR